MRERSALRNAAELRAMLLLAAAARALPQRMVLAAGSAIGSLFYRLDARHRRVALRNLADCFPSLSAAEREQLARETFRQLVRSALSWLRRTQAPPDVLRAEVEIEGGEHVERAYAAGRGVLFYSGHFGPWELQAITHAVCFQPGGLMARPLDNPGLHAWLEGVRQRTGNVVLYRDGAVRRARRLLAEGRGVALHIDQHTHTRDAIRVQFFGRPVHTTSTLAALALRSGAVVLPTFAMPLPDGRLRMVYEPPVEPPPADHPDPVREFSQRCTDVMERYVRTHPTCWFWMHRRWRDEVLQEAEVPPAPVVVPTG